MYNFQTFTIIILLGSSLLSCGDRSIAILNNKNFDDGKWLLVIDNKAENTLFVVEDKNVLKSNPFGLLLTASAECGGTTCDGFIELYKDGELIASQEFLSKSALIENENIKRVYKKATTDCIYPIDESRFKRLWDSLINKNNYPTRQHTDPQSRDIICFYSYK